VSGRLSIPFEGQRFFPVGGPEIGFGEESRGAAEVLYFLDDPGGITGHNRVWGDIVHNHGTGPDEGISSDDDSGKNGDIGTDAGQLFDTGPSETFLIMWAVHRVWIIGEDGVRPDEDVIGYRDHLQETAAMDADVVADGVIEFQNGIGAHADSVADPVILADGSPLACLEIIADMVAGVNGREGSDDGHPADDDRQCPRFGPARGLSDDAGSMNDGPGTDLNVGIDTAVILDLHSGKPAFCAQSIFSTCPLFSRDFWAASSARTTRNPLEPSVLGLLPFMMQS
jgi:hypothetical protein